MNNTRAFNNSSRTLRGCPFGLTSTSKLRSASEIVAVCQEATRSRDGRSQYTPGDKGRPSGPARCFVAEWMGPKLYFAGDPGPGRMINGAVRVGLNENFQSQL